MSAPINGGPAFPQPATPKEYSAAPQPGMSLRDWFAGQAIPECDWSRELNVAAEAAYKIADAMLAVRNKKGIT